MKSKSNTTSLWTRHKTSIQALTALAVLGGLTGLGQAQTTYTPVFTNLVWNVAPGVFADLPTSGNNVRGVAINPVTTNVLFASSIGGTNSGVNHVATLGFSGGTYLAGLNGTGFGAGTVATAGIRCSDDGIIYACNVSGSPASTFKIWRWDSDTDITTAPQVVYNSGAGTSFQWRLGDYMDVRGSGIKTEIVVVGPGSGANITTNFVIFRPTDSTCTLFTNFSITIPGSANPVPASSVNLCGAGVAFEGTNNVIWIRRAGSQETRRVAYDPTNLTAVATRTNNVDQSVCQGLKYFAATNGVQLLATVQANTGAGGVQIARVFNVSASGNSGTLVSVLSSNINVPGFANGNGLGNVDYQKGYFVFGAPNNGIALYQLGFNTQSPPAVNISSSGSTFVAGYNLNDVFTATASGSSPLSYQWYATNGIATNLIVGATNSTFTITNVQTTNAGSYYVIVTNLYGRATSSLAGVTVLLNGGSSFASPLWSLAPGSRPYLTGAGTDTQRGLAYDANSNRVVVVSRVSHTNLNDGVTIVPYGAILLDANTGAEVGELDMSTLWSVTPPGTFPVNMCGVADDGVVYVGNLITSAASDTFAIYSWNAADPLVGMNGTPAYYANPMGVAYPGSGAVGRIGDSMAVRGAGTNTQILCPFRNGTNVCIFTTADGVNFDAHVVAVTNLSASAGLTDPFSGASPLALGCAFGSGNTFWAKSSLYNLRQVSFNLDDNTAAVIGSHAITGTEAPLGVNNVGGYIGIIGHNELPMNLALYDINNTANLVTAGLADRELFGLGTSSAANGNGTGSVGFDTTRARVFALSSNNGILALQVNPATPSATDVPLGGTITWTGPGILQSATDVTGPYTDVVGAVSPYTNTGAAQMFFRVKR